jgi:schlafen family protein
VTNSSLRAAVQRSYYSGTITEFCVADLNEIFARMARRNDFDLTGTQRDAWLEQAEILRRVLAGRQGTLYLEFTIPRMGRRIDALVIIGPVIFVLEFKVGEQIFLSQDMDQVVDYALDLHNFHEGSHHTYIAPVLVCTRADRKNQGIPDMPPSDFLFEGSRTNADGLAATIERILSLVEAPDIRIDQWEESGYKPTPTIIEATLALYRRHSVTEISRSDAGATNLSKTAGTVASIIAEIKARSQKAICFVTGVPGAGKTLVGLDAATKHIDHRDELYSVFLSGNGPLVKILQEALARDKIRQERLRGRVVRKGAALSEVRAFIQNVHNFRDECLVDFERPPVEHVAIFDEAQRAWNLKQTADFMKRKKGRANFSQSEPEFLISCLDRHKDWAVVICLVGGGQEINTGEAGIVEWLEALGRSFPDWWIYVSDRLVDNEYGAGGVVEALRTREHVEFKSDLHLATSVRSFRSENVSRLVKELLDLELDAALATLQLVQERYPIVLTRDLNSARRWLRSKARGSERYGIVVSSQAERLKPYALDVKTPVNPVHWFLNDKDDVRSSYYLEDVATEFDVQGLELDWTCVVWDADFRYTPKGWQHWSFRGKGWQRIHSPERRLYLKNAYRVLLTRARQGMVVVVPRGDDEDPTRNPAYYDQTFEYLSRSGMSLI